jgi:folylpolyglutamate synthase/dihydrofolate synthase
MQKDILNFQDAMNYVNEISKYGSVLGLESLTELLSRLNNPQDRLQFIHIAGTNGKGSTAAYISSILSEAGYRVGRYISPTVFEYRERIQISQSKTEYITEKAVISHLNKIKKAMDSMEEDGLAHPTIFEVETAMAFLEFVEQACDIVVLEVGMGGRLDATNVIRNTVCAVLTAISMDHMQFLGDTLVKIANEKAGIIKDGCTVISYDQEIEARIVIENRCMEKNAVRTMLDFQNISNEVHTLEGITFDYGRFHNIQTKLLGGYQVKNASVAIETALALQTLGYEISDQSIIEGIKKTEWRARFEIIQTSPYFVVDGAHNEAAAKELRNSIVKYFPDRKVYYIMGVLADKDYESILANTGDLAYMILTITPNNFRGLESAELAEHAKKYCNRIYDAKTIPNAMKKVKELAAADDVILAFGSLSYLGEIYTYA